MIDMVQERRNADSKEEMNDLMSSLLDASDEEFRGAAKLTDREVISEFFKHLATVQLFILYTTGNIFIFLIAGHEVFAAYAYVRVW